MTAALPIGAAVLGIGALLALLIPGKRAATEEARVNAAPSATLAEAAAKTGRGPGDPLGIARPSWRLRPGRAWRPWW